MKKLICPHCHALDSAVIKHDTDNRFDLPYNVCRDSDDWYDFLSEMIGEENDKVVIYCEYCKHEGEIMDFEVEEPIRSDFEIMISYIDKTYSDGGRLKIEYVKCRNYREFQVKLKELANKDSKYLEMLRVDPLCRIRDYPLSWEGLPLSEVMGWQEDK